MRSKKQPTKGKSSHKCRRHSERPFDFICVNRACIQELCSLCILEHRDHIDDVKPISQALAELSATLRPLHEEETEERVMQVRESTFRSLDSFASKMKDIIFDKVNRYKTQLIMSDETVCSVADNVINFQSFFKNYDESQPSFVSEESIGLLRTCIKDQDMYKTNSFCIDEAVILGQFEKLLDNNIQALVDGHSLNTTGPGVPKYVHWFEWEKKELHLFDTIENTYHNIKLITGFKTALFSRSIMLPDGVILLIGGQDSNVGAIKEVYEFDLKVLRPEVRAMCRAPMIFKKYDFALSYHQGYVYVMCGKNGDNEVVAHCERYDVAANKWELLSNAHRRRYAATASVIHETSKIYLIGGRSEGNTGMIPEIEEYTIQTDTWRMLRLANPNVWIPVEVCASVQVGAGQILIFGGSDIQVEDSNASYILTPADAKITKVSNLKKSQVFVNPPFVNGNFVYVAGNHYYINSRNIHRFNIRKQTWDMVK